MIKSFVSIPPHLPVQSAVDEYFVPHGAGGFPVSEEDRVIGIITVDDVQALPQSLWPWRQVRDVMQPADSGRCVPPDWSVKQALDRMVQEEWDGLVVIADGKPIGLLTRAVVARFLQLKR
jgi:predicted transcriptional regulator